MVTWGLPRSLGLKRTTLQSRIKKLNIERHTNESGPAPSGSRPPEPSRCCRRSALPRDRQQGTREVSRARCKALIDIVNPTLREFSMSLIATGQVSV